uniref:Protein transport protein Sec61 subunit beta n=1 Tax=Phallusia mammillata TaxID=59560 RepID=A0A6F9DSE5_9ASCI|nr:protein transport protein Sec61 subunit beta [Phallusia mammillata]
MQFFTIKTNCNKLKFIKITYFCETYFRLCHHQAQLLWVGGDPQADPLPQELGLEPPWRQRKATPTTRSKSTPGGGSGARSTMWRYYSEDSPGLKVGPVPELIISLLFIASVFMLHIWGKYTKA